MANTSNSYALNYINVYESGLQGKWVESTWGDIDLVDLSASAPGRSGTTVEVRFGPQNGWNAFGFGTSDWSSPWFLNEIRTIEFDLYIENDSTGMENLSFILDDAGLADEPKLADFIPGWTGMSDAERYGHWFHVTIFLDQLQPKIPHFGRFLLFNGAAAEASQPHFRLASVRLGWVHDRKPPVVKFGSATTNLTYDELTLAFSTNEASTYRVDYVVSDYDSKVEDLTTWAKSHQAVLPSLTPGSTVLYRIVALDHRVDPEAMPNEGVREGSYTLPPAPTTPPVIATFTVAGVEGHKANLAWGTNRPCTAMLTYWKNGSGAVMTRSLKDYAACRKFVLDLLEPSSTYAGTIEVRDAFGLDFVAINRSDGFQDVSLNNLPLQGIVRIYRLAANSSDPAFVGEVSSKGPSLVVALPPMSISTLDIH